MFSQEIPESNYPTSTTLVVVSRSLRQHFACRRTQLSSLEVISRDVDLTSKLIYDIVMHNAPVHKFSDQFNHPYFIPHKLGPKHEILD